MGLLHRLGLGLLLAVAGCHAPSAAPVVLEFWAIGREGEVIQSLLPEFERRTPGVRVRVQQIPWSAAHEKLLTAYVGNAMPDIFQAGNTWIPEFVALNAIAPLGERVARSTVLRTGDQFSGILDTNIIDGVTYGVPWYVDTRLLFYRTDTLRNAGYAQPPTTWDAWVDAMTRIEERVGAGNYAVLLPMTEWQTPVILALQLNAGLLRDHEQYGDFRNPAFRRAFAFYLDLFRRHLAPRAGAAQVANIYQDFANGYFAFYVSGPWNIGEFRRRLPSAMADTWATAPLPAPDEHYPGVSIAGGASLVIVRQSPHQDAAWQLIEYLCEPAQQAAFYRLTGDLPASAAAWREAGLADDRYAGAFWTQLQHVRSTPKIPEWERIASAIGQYAEAAVRGDLTAEQALTALDTDVDAILDKRRWMLRRSAGAEPAS